MRILIITLCLFTSLAVAAQEKVKDPCPCCGPEYRQFDFWVGDWVTYAAHDDNRLAGYNQIEVLQDSCVIRENWVSAEGQYTGTSFNWYDNQSGKWHQSWIDNQGGSLRLEGGLENGAMVLYSRSGKPSGGEQPLNRITWTPRDDGSVRQHWEISKDKGKTWKTAFDGIYKQKDNH